MHEYLSSDDTSTYTVDLGWKERKKASTDVASVAVQVYLLGATVDLPLS